MLQVKWRASALSDAELIVTYTKDCWGQEKADVIIRLFAESAALLSRMPRLGRPLKDREVFALILQKVPFVFIYHIETEHVVIDQVLHTRRRR